MFWIAALVSLAIRVTDALSGRSFITDAAPRATRAHSAPVLVGSVSVERKI